MGKQTYIIHTSGGGKTDFYRVSCKKVETCLKYLKGWRDQAKEKGWNYLYKDLLSDDSTYKIISTPDGYHEKDLVASGFISEL